MCVPAYVHVCACLRVCVCVCVCVCERERETERERDRERERETEREKINWKYLFDLLESQENKTVSASILCQQFVSVTS